MNADPITIWEVLVGGAPMSVRHTPEKGLIYADMLVGWEHVEHWRGCTMLFEGYFDDWASCPDGCGDQPITLSGLNPGFTGAPIYWAYLKCGHQWYDASADNAAAAE